MPNNPILIQPLLKSIEQYSATNLKLFKLYVVDFISNFLSELFSILIIWVLLGLCILFLSIGLSLWIGELLGKNYYGFLIVSGFYLLVTFIFIKFKHFIVNEPSYNSIARKLK
jgi:hypothetical protein